MNRALLLITLLIAVSSCDSLDDSPGDVEGEEIESIHWLPGDSLLLALASVPSGSGYDRDLFIRIYDLAGTTREQFQISFDPYANGHELRVTLGGRTAVFNDYGDLAMVDLATHNKTIALQSTDLISYAPDRDVCVLFRRADNMNYSDFLDTFALATIEGSSITIDTLFQIDPGFNFTRSFPLLLSEGRLATLESDTLFSSKMFIRDLDLEIERIFHLPMTLSLRSPKVVAGSPDFFFISDDMNGHRINRFRTDVGFVDPLPDLDIYSTLYAIVGGGDKVVCLEAGSKRCVLMDIESGVITPIPGTDGVDGFYLSNDSKRLAVVREGAKVSVVPLPEN